MVYNAKPCTFGFQIDNSKTRRLDEGFQIPRYREGFLLLSYRKRLSLPQGSSLVARRQVNAMLSNKYATPGCLIHPGVFEYPQPA